MYESQLNYRNSQNKYFLKNTFNNSKVAVMQLFSSLFDLLFPARPLTNQPGNFFYLFFYFGSEFCHTLKWNSHGFTCVPHPDQPGNFQLSVFVLLLCSHSALSNSLQPHGLQLARLPCPTLSPRVCSSSCPLSWYCHPAISSSVAPFSWLQSFPA